MKIIGLCLISSATFASAELERAAQLGHASDPRRLQEWGWGRQYFGRNWRKDNWGYNNDKDSYGASWIKDENDKADSNGWGENGKVDSNNWNKPNGGSWNYNNDKEESHNNLNNWNKPSGSSWNKPNGHSWNNDKEDDIQWNGSNSWNKPDGGDGSKPGESEWDGNSGDKPGEGGWNWGDNDKEDGSNWNGVSNWNKPDGGDGGKPGHSGWGSNNADKPGGSSWGGNDDGKPGESWWGGSNGGKPGNNGGDNNGGKPGNDNGNNDGGKPDGDNGGGAINPDGFVSLSDLGSPGQFNVRVQHGGIDREFIVYVPQSYDSSQRVPLLFNFHGFGGSMYGYMVGEADMRPVADAENFILVYPQGSSQISSNSPHWNTAPLGSDSKSTADDIGFVNQLIDRLGSVYSVDISRVYAAGYSNGGGMAYYLGCDLSQRIAGIASVASSMMDQGCNPSHPMPMISLHGTTDSVVPYNGGSGWTGASQTLNYWVNFNGAQTPAVITTDRSSGMTIERSVFAAGQSAVSIEHYRYMNGGHVWFQNNFQGRSTGQLIWDYLSQFSLDNLGN